MKKSVRAPQCGIQAQRVPNTRLKAQRLKKNWTQVYVATQLGTNFVEVSRWETGSAVPSLYFREQLCTLFNTTPEELGFTFSPPEPVQASNGSSSSSLWHIPYRRNRFFTGRTEYLEQIHRQLQAGEGDETQTVAISGLGGIGKTQLVLEYAYRYRYHYHATLWLQADTSERLQAELAGLAAFLQLPEQQARDQEQAIRAVRRWFEQHSNWLLILDNVEAILDINSLLPDGSGAILLTTQAQACGSFAWQVHLDTLTQDEAITFLLRRAKVAGEQEPLEQTGGPLQELARVIVHELGCLPLALDQAGAYIEEAGCGLAGFLQRYRMRRADVLRRRGRLSADHPDPVSTTFALSYEQVKRMNKAAAELLHFCAFLAPDAIPEELLTDGASESGPLLASVAADPVAFDEALAALRSYSLIHRQAETHTFSIHRLVQAVLKDRMDEATRRLWAERALSAVHRLFPREMNMDAWPQCKRYLPHALWCSQFIEGEHLYFLDAEQLLTRTGIYLKERARYREAEALFQQALEQHAHLQSPTHHNHAQTLHHLGQLYFEQGLYRQAETCLLQTIALQREHRGMQYQERIETLNLLGMLYMLKCRTSEAERLFQQAILLWEQINSQHPVGIQSLLGRGWCYVQARRYHEAAPLLQQALTLLEQGAPDHRITIHGFRQLGWLSMLQGDEQKAEAFFQRALELWEQLEFPHPCTALVFNNLAALRIRQGKYDEAEAYFRRSLTFWEQVSFRYPLVAEGLSGLTQLLIECGKEAEAEPLLRQALHMREHWLGKDDPETIATAESYRALLQRLRQENEASAALP
jgi:tetratricopeptide (TPR) repeat protein/DNA-binding transcriptional regulator YiaG